MKLEGSLEIFPLRELIDIAVYSSVTGALNIYCRRGQGRLYFREGVLYHAEHGASTGVDALAELFELGDGNFAFVSEIVSDQETLWGSLTYHLQTAERMALRWRQVRPYVPTLELTPALLVAREAALRRINPAHQPVLAAIDGQATLRQIAATVNWAAIDVAEAIVQMTLDGVVALHNQRPNAPTGPESEPPQQAGGIFDRLRAKAHPGQGPTGDGKPACQAENRAAEELILKLLRS